MKKLRNGGTQLNNDLKEITNKHIHREIEIFPLRELTDLHRSREREIHKHRHQYIHRELETVL